MIKSAILPLLLLLAACGHHSTGSDPPSPDIIEAKETLAATGGDIKYDYDNISIWQINQAFGGMVGGSDYGCGVDDIAPLPCKRFGAVWRIMFDGMDYRTWIYDEIKDMPFKGVFTGETIARYHTGGIGDLDSKLDYGIVKLTAVSHDDWRLDVKLAVNGEFNNISTKTIYDYWIKNGGIQGVGGDYTIPDTGNGTYIFGEFRAKRR